MKLLKFLACLLLSWSICQLSSQNHQEEAVYKGIVSGKIYSNFNYTINVPEKNTEFALTRAYFGYERQLSAHFYANVKLDVGSPDDISEFSRINRYAYFKNAGIRFSKDNFTAWAGLFDMVQFKLQENFWGYRYLYRSFMDEYRFGPSSALGAGVQYRFNQFLEVDLVVSNGEGYSSPQRDDNYKAGWGLTFTPTEQVTLRSYYSIFMTNTPQMTFSGFAGYDIGNFRLGTEYNHQLNYQFNYNYNRYGYSLYSTYLFSDKWEVFIRYDQLYSNIIRESSVPWNLANDGSAIIGGIQFSPIENIHLTADYQDWVEFAGNGEKIQVLFIHLEATF
jgi:hypothetical protein